MTNFSNCYFLVILLIFKTKTCKTDNLKINDLESSDSDDISDSADVSTDGLSIDQNVCELPIDAGDCEAESLATHENGLSNNAVKELYEINNIYEVKEIYVINGRNGRKQLNVLNELKDDNAHTRYFGYNINTKKCEEFNYDGCGGNDNRFATLNKCRKTCYTSLKYFLSEVTDLILFKLRTYSSEVPAT